MCQLYSHNTVVLTVATAHPYLKAAHELALSAVAVGIPCIHIALPVALAGAAMPPLVELRLGNGAAAYLPPREWCASTASWEVRSGYRQTHILKTQAIVDVLRLGHDVLCIDSDRRFVRNPLAALRATNADIAAMRDEALLNYGLIFLRVSAAQLTLAERVANRSYAAWDQAIFNEEAAAATALQCCYTNGFIQKCVRIVESLHVLRRGPNANATQASQSGCAPKPQPIRALGPPPLSSLSRAAVSTRRLFRSWNAQAYNELPWSWRHYSRCSNHACPAAADACEAATIANSGGGSGGSDGGSSISSVGRGADSGSSHPENPFICTTWPSRAPVNWSDAKRCDQGNLLNDGYEYVHNIGRGTKLAKCAGSCTCCRRCRSHLQAVGSKLGGRNHLTCDF